MLVAQFLQSYGFYGFLFSLFSKIGHQWPFTNLKKTGRPQKRGQVSGGGFGAFKGVGTVATLFKP